MFVDALKLTEHVPADLRPVVIGKCLRVWAFLSYFVKEHKLTKPFQSFAEQAAIDFQERVAPAIKEFQEDRQTFSGYEEFKQGVYASPYTRVCPKILEVIQSLDDFEIECEQAHD